VISEISETDFERFETVAAIAERAGMPEEHVRSACHRDAAHHPLPHTEHGAKRPVIRVRWSDFCRWADEEPRYQVGLTV
jgi:hypothetical protein